MFMKKSASEKLEIVSTPRYLLSEKQLASIPLWEPKKKGGRGPGPREKKVHFNTAVKGVPVQLTIKVLAGGNYEFPNTTDLDFFRAIEQIATEQIQNLGVVDNPIRVSGKEILTNAGKKSCGSAYQDLRRCIGKLSALSFEVVRKEGKRERSWKFHLFNSVYQEGEKRADGTLTELNEIELASWYWKSLQAGNCLVIDHDLFRRLKLSLSKLLHQFLHAQFYLHHGVATEWYSALAQNWRMVEHREPARIKSQLDPSHKELQHMGFLDSWEYRPFKQNGKRVFQVSWKAGPQWWEMARIQKLELDHHEEGGDHLLFLGEPTELAGEGEEGSEGVLVNILDLVGTSDKKYLPFWKQAVRDLPKSVVYKQMGDLRERLADGEKIRNKGAYLMKLFRLEAKKRELSWAMKE
jgi:hypothetical protein